jgi:hypothetical protein
VLARRSKTGTFQMPDESDWHKEQLKPLSMFELAKWWADAIKVIGAGNGTGLIAAGAALGPFQDHHHSLFFVKLAGAVFFVGVFGIAIAFAMLHRALFAQDEISQALLRKDELAIRENAAISGSSMRQKNLWAIVAALAFFAGLFSALFAFLFY